MPPIRVPELANRNTGCPKKSEFQINDEYFSSISMSQVPGGRAQEKGQRGRELPTQPASLICGALEGEGVGGGPPWSLSGPLAVPPGRWCVWSC